ncbi:MAG: hypothetical protein MJK18_01750 [Bdellovibrionales bacterium]|nr:hypothetical protein [Bdellovibrionales bacterium]
MEIITFSATALFIYTISLNAEVTSPGQGDPTNGGEYSRVGVTGFVDLDVFPQNAYGNSTIQGVVLECARDQDGRVGFCTNSDCTNSRAPNSGVKISKEYADYIEEWGYKCFQEIVDTPEFNCTGGVAMCGASGHAKRNARNGGNTGVPSRHSTGDAMDVSGSLYCGDREVARFGVSGRAFNPEAYDKFVKCWDDTARLAYASQDSTDVQRYEAAGGCIGCVGSPVPDSSGGHDDNIHMSAPINRPGRISTK